jgi:hypothetical protein
MTFAKFALHLFESKVAVVIMSLSETIEQVVIRGEHFDSEVAAIHRDGNTLILDMGHRLKDVPYCPEHNNNLPCRQCH